MSDAAVIVGEIIVGLAFLAVLTAVLSVWATRLLSKTSPADVLDDRYASGELTREQYQLMRLDLGIGSRPTSGLGAPQPNG